MNSSANNGYRFGNWYEIRINSFHVTVYGNRKFEIVDMFVDILMKVLLVSKARNYIPLKI